MKIMYMSDLHLDTNTGHFKTDLLPLLIKEINNQKPDLLLIGGDISSDAKTTINVLNAIEKRTNIKTLFVPGNHDIWVDSPNSSWDSYEKLKQHKTSLIKKPYKVNDEWVIIGDMGWYDYSFIKEDINIEEVKYRKKSLWQDGKYAKFNMNDEELFKKMMNNFNIQLEKYKDKKVIFLNHFIPYRDFVIYSSERGWNMCNAYMGSKHLGELLDQYKNVEYVLFGHTHKRYGTVDFEDKKVICNPLGYYYEWEEDDFAKELKKSIQIIKI